MKLTNSSLVPRDMELWEHIKNSFPSLKFTIYFSILLNMLSLAPSIYMLEVYDRVLTSRSESTLLMLTLAVIGSYVVHELLELLRKGIMQTAARKFNDDLVERIFGAIHRGNLLRIPGITLKPLTDHKELRTFMSSPAMMAMIDAPISLLFLIVIFSVDYRMGVFALLGLLAQLFLMWMNHRKVHPSLNEAQLAANISQSHAVLNLKNAQVIESMGMESAISKEWERRQFRFLEKQAVASDYGGAINAASKFVQLFQGSALLGFGCWLVINGHDDSTGGLIMLISILATRGLQPMAILVASWKTVVDARSAYQRLKQLLTLIPCQVESMPLPAPKGHLTIESIVVAAPGTNAPILKNISFQIPAGQFLSIAGPSGSGKSSLARVLVGVWPTASGKVRMDGVDIYQWNKTELGPHVGYLPQEIELFDGTVAENIARFGEVDLLKVKQATALVGLHETIEALPKGYESEIGEEGGIFSGGQRQRLGLARAIYGNPKLLVLDEPNSSLDQAGDAALLKTLEVMKSQGTTIVVVTHRTNVIQVSDLLLILNEGVTTAWGPKDGVLKALEDAKQKALSGAAQR